MKLCRVCSKSLGYYRSVFCSDGCAESHRKHRNQGRPCAACGSPIPKKRWRFCSDKCQYQVTLLEIRQRGKIARASVERPSRHCPFCGCEFIPNQKTRKYCSEKCRMAHRPQLDRIRNGSKPKNEHQRKCVVCRTEYIGNRTSLYCSTKCWRTAWKSRPSGKRAMARHLKRSRERYATDPTYRQKMIDAAKVAMKTNPIIRLRQRLRKRVRSMMKRNVRGISRLVGCNSLELRKWLEFRFSKGMNWTNYGTIWVVDHKIPLARFNLEDPQERAKACHFTNLQPLTKKDNHQKADKIIDPQHSLLL